MARLTEDADPALLTGRRVGLEKESLRVDKRGGIARTDHPAALGRMQAIAGIHFNFSLPETAWEWRLDAAGPLRDTSAGYFSMMQNLIGISWLVPYLFGASSAICRSFLGDDAKTELESLGEATLFEPYGTSLRMGNIGYRYREDSKIDLSVDHHNCSSLQACRWRPSRFLKC